ncbi:hypothetical protein Q4610_06090 [Sphingobium sp. HBC34]|uniref:Uncharacterized protein n=1 Tax=Sphingobium cyanobacteriorum TaxID=3063954 RepID=A0ABT8ZM87_9SPHN|nr:hypothetical protein [Sphingobium sp. HBC34]MDO7834611.1 hypothetical protein [Sphingobium sp. HBC34]
MSGEFTELARVEMLAREREYLHRTFWVSFNIWGLLVGAAILGPFLKPDLTDVGWPILIVPTYGAGIALFAHYHLASEARRIRGVADAYKKFRDVSYDEMIAPRGRYKKIIYQLSIAKVVANVFLYILSPACLSSALILSVQIYDRYGFYFSFEISGFVRAVAYLMASFAPVAGLWLCWRRTIEAIKRKEGRVMPDIRQQTDNHA